MQTVKQCDHEGYLVPVENHLPKEDFYSLGSFPSFGGTQNDVKKVGQSLFLKDFFTHMFGILKLKNKSVSHASTDNILGARQVT